MGASRPRKGASALGALLVLGAVAFALVVLFAPPASASALWVAVGSDGGLVTSPDGSAWTLVPGVHSGALRGVEFGNGVWVTVGEGCFIARSVDGGLSWPAVATPAACTERLWSVATDGNNNWVAVGGTGGGPGVALYSTDGGATWTYVLSPALSDLLYTVATDGLGHWVAMGASGVAAYSTNNGATWTPMPTNPWLASASPSPWSCPGSGCGENVDTTLRGVDVNPAGEWCAVGHYGRYFRSTDGMTWTWQGDRLFGDHRWGLDVTWGDGTWVAVGGNVNNGNARSNADCSYTGGAYGSAWSNIALGTHSCCYLRAVASLAPTNPGDPWIWKAVGDHSGNHVERTTGAFSVLPWPLSPSIVWDIAVGGPGSIDVDFGFTPACHNKPIKVVDLSESAGFTIQSVYWDFGDGTVTGPHGWPGNTSHIYTAPGTYTVTLSVHDSRGNVTTASKPVTVCNDPPQLDPGPERVVVVGRSLVHAIQIYDPNDDPVTVWMDPATQLVDASWNPKTYTMHWIPRNADLGVHYLHFHAADPWGGTDDGWLVVRVIPAEGGPPASWDSTRDGNPDMLDSCPEAFTPDAGAERVSGPCLRSDAGGGSLPGRGLGSGGSGTGPSPVADSVDPRCPSDGRIQNVQAQAGPDADHLKVSWDVAEGCAAESYAVWREDGERLEAVVLHLQKASVQSVLVPLDGVVPRHYTVQALHADEGPLFDPDRAVASNRIDPCTVVPLMAHPACFGGERATAVQPEPEQESPPVPVAVPLQPYEPPEIHGAQGAASLGIQPLAVLFVVLAAAAVFAMFAFIALRRRR